MWLRCLKCRRNGGDAAGGRSLAIEHLYVTKVLMKQLVDDLGSSPRLGSSVDASDLSNLKQLLRQP
jgi:hypothetical protein